MNSISIGTLGFLSFFSPYTFPCTSTPNRTFMEICDWLKKDTARVKVIQYDRLFIRFLSPQEFLPCGGRVHNMSRVRVCAAHVDWFSSPKFSK